MFLIPIKASLRKLVAIGIPREDVGKDRKRRRS